MYIANKTQIAQFTGLAPYVSGAYIGAEAAKINQMVIDQTGGKMPCYAARIGKRGAIVWVSIGSSARISRGEAKSWLAQCGGDLDQVETEWVFTIGKP